jgi:hypothetical protein
VEIMGSLGLPKPKQIDRAVQANLKVRCCGARVCAQRGRAGWWDVPALRVPACGALLAAAHGAPLLLPCVCHAPQCGVDFPYA